MATAKTLDFTNVKEGGVFSKTHMPSGDYAAKVTKVQDAKSKSDDTPMWLFTIQLKSRPSATYPYYIKLQENQLWKLRNLLTAAGINVPKKRVKVDPERVVGKDIAVSLEDEEYDGKMQSVVQSTFPLADLESEGGETPDSDEEEEEEDAEEEEEEEEEAPPAKTKKAKSSAKQVAEVNDEELEELDIDEI